jgi:hypothetical protein
MEPIHSCKRLLRDVQHRPEHRYTTQQRSAGGRETAPEYGLHRQDIRVGGTGRVYGTRATTRREPRQHRRRPTSSSPV